jgi:hypothetical protein
MPLRARTDCPQAGSEAHRQEVRIACPSIEGGSSVCDHAPMAGAVERERALERLRELCLSLPETSERLSHGAPTFFVRGKRAFLMVLTDHHGDGRSAVWCAAPDGMQGVLTESDPERFFVPPYVGHRGWLGVRLDQGLSWDEIAGIAEDAYAQVAPSTLVDAARRGKS